MAQVNPFNTQEIYKLIKPKSKTTPNHPIYCVIQSSKTVQQPMKILSYTMKVSARWGCAWISFAIRSLHLCSKNFNYIKKAFGEWLQVTAINHRVTKWVGSDGEMSLWKYNQIQVFKLSPIVGRMTILYYMLGLHL